VRKNVLFAVLPGTVLLDVAGPAEAFRIASQSVSAAYALSFAGSTRTIETGVGLQIGSVQPLPKHVETGSIIVVPGVIGERVDYTSPAVRQLCEWLRFAVAAENVTLMCVCAGSVVAAHAGVLNGRECTTHHSHIEELQRAEPTARVHDNRIFVEDGNVLTSAGVTAGIDLALYVIGKQLGHQVAASVARQLVVYMRRSGSDPALSPWLMHRNHIHPVVHRVQDAVSRDPSAEWPAGRLADIAHTSPRNLARLFAQHAQCSPLDYVQRMRVALARELLTQSTLPLERVAERVGFSSAHQLRRVWRRWEAAPPSASRVSATG
jgi:transcriptional regulator GlxA family with amidase domain